MLLQLASCHALPVNAKSSMLALLFLSLVRQKCSLAGQTHEILLPST